LGNCPFHDNQKNIYYTIANKKDGMNMIKVGKHYLQDAYTAVFFQDLKRAVVSFQRAIQEEPRNPNYYYKLSLAFLNHRRYDEALEYAEKTLKILPYSPLYQSYLEFVKSVRPVKGTARQADTSASGVGINEVEKEPGNKENN
jgi:tetratricopeptide (TPR) repeat protein